MGKSTKIESTLLGVAFGDAYGAITEFTPLKKIREEHGPYGPTFPEEARVTDDTQMSLAVLDALSDPNLRNEDGTLDIQGARTNLVLAYINWLNDEHNTPDRAPGQSCIKAVRALDNGKAWQKATRATSKGSGTVMRSGVIGIIPGYSAEEVARLSALSAVLTHGHPTAVYSAVVASLLVHELSSEILDITKVAERALEIAIDQMTENEYDEEILGDVWQRAGFDTAQSYHYFGWNEIISVLRKAKNSAAAVRKDEDWDTDPCSITGEGWTAEEALGTAVLIAAALGEDPGLALRRSMMTNGDSDSIGAVVGALVGATGFDWSQGWKRSLESFYMVEIGLRAATITSV